MRRPAGGWSGAWQISKLRRTWYDTQGGTLSARNVALAEDGDGWQVGCIRSDRPPWLPDATWSAPAAATPDAALGFKPDGALLPIVVLEGERWQAGANVHDVALSIVTGRWLTLAAQRPFCHLRLTGAAMPVVAAAAALSRSHPLSIPVCGFNSEAMAFARGQDLSLKTQAPAGAGPPRLCPGRSVEDSFIAIVVHLTESLVFWASLLPSGIDPGEPPEPVHQMRVALRRLRSAMRAFAGVLACPAMDDLRAELRALGHVLGPARDWDVFLSQTLTEVITSLPAEPSLPRLHRAAIRARRAAYAGLHAYFAERRFARLSIGIAGLTMARPWAAIADDLLRELQRAPIEDFAARSLRHNWRKMRRAGATILTLPPAELHALRLRGKQLRYLAEFFSPLFGGKTGGHFIRRLARLQEHLGVLNDGMVAAEMMASLPPATRRAQGIVQGFVAGRSGDAKRCLGETWQRLTHQDGFWS